MSEIQKIYHLLELLLEHAGNEEDDIAHFLAGEVKNNLDKIAEIGDVVVRIKQ